MGLQHNLLWFLGKGKLEMWTLSMSENQIVIKDLLKSVYIKGPFYKSHGI